MRTPLLLSDPHVFVDLLRGDSLWLVSAIHASDAMISASLPPLRASIMPSGDGAQASSSALGRKFGHLTIPLYGETGHKKTSPENALHASYGMDPRARTVQAAELHRNALYALLLNGLDAIRSATSAHSADMIPVCSSSDSPDSAAVYTGLHSPLAPTPLLGVPELRVWRLTSNGRMEFTQVSRI
ncbi:hypothetical protein HPB50_016757 [Hyalomma asiaticum]|uniref:Uncharacterized protein n=1 Tax=Hyalomma asiaticum TaxID=266040 RepID=A0ACB7SI55_HYAAI|nr:hypothetical protein HPB50_016757 [Hyalomma asiaticum]